MRAIWLRALAVVWCACVAVAVCGCGRGTDIFGRPNPLLPFDRRAPIRVYLSDAEPLIERFVDALAKQNGGALGYAGYAHFNGCGDTGDDDGIRVASPIFKVLMTDAMDLRALSEQILEPAGFTPPDTFVPDEERSLVWGEDRNGTLLSVYYVPGQMVRFHYHSGCVPFGDMSEDDLKARVYGRDLTQTFPDLLLYQSFDADGNPQGPPDHQSGTTAQPTQSGDGQ